MKGVRKLREKKGMQNKSNTHAHKILGKLGFDCKNNY